MENLLPMIEGVLVFVKACVVIIGGVMIFGILILFLDTIFRGDKDDSSF